MGSAVDHGVEGPGFAQPQIEGAIGVGGRQIGVMIIRLHISAGTHRLQGDQQIARFHYAKVKGAFAQQWIARGRTPSGGHLILEGLWQGGEEARIGLEFQLRCRRILRQTLHQTSCVNFADIIALRLQRLRNRSHAGGGVEAHGVTGLPALVRIIREDAGDAALCGFETAQMRPGAG